MGYFSSGTEGIAYMERFCANCANCGDEAYEFGCGVWDLHTLFMSDREPDDSGPVAEMLDTLIPRTADGLDNGQCRMFRPATGQMLGETLLEWFDRVHGDGSVAHA